MAELLIKMARSQEDDNFNPLNNKRKRVRFLADCEEARIGLSYYSEVDIDLSGYGLEEEYMVSRTQLQSIFSKTLKSRIDDCLNRILVGPSLSRGVIKHVFLVGGSTRLVAVQDYLHAYFHCDFPTVNPDTCVAEGALAVARSQKESCPKCCVGRPLL